MIKLKKKEKGRRISKWKLAEEKKKSNKERIKEREASK